MLRELVIHKPEEPISFLLDVLRHNDPLKVIIAGPPAGGKGTQCEKIVEEFGVVHISTGDLLREAVKAGTELGRQAQTYMSAGALVPDPIVIEMVKARLAREDCQTKGWLLDGFPRTRAQALALQEAGILASKFILLEVADDVVISRVTGRRSDPVTGKIYHVKFAPPENEEIASRLVQRADDTEEVMRPRLEAYHRNVSAVMECYAPVMRRFDGTASPSEIFDEIRSFLHAAPSSVLSKGLKVIIFGAPASGKGTQCEAIVKAFGLVHISTGDLLRESVSKGTELGLKAKEFMDRGELVPDDVVIEIVRDRLTANDCRNLGWLLDGFPRTKAQAMALSRMGVVPDKVVDLQVPDYVLVDRVCGRRVDPVTGKIYHVKFNPPPPDVAERVVQRSDDNELTMKTRLAAYQKNADEVLANYRTLVRGFDGTLAPDEIARNIKGYLEE